MSKHFHTLKHNVWLPYRFSVGATFHKFFDGLKEKKIWGNQCPACNKVLVPARSFCPECNQDMGEWIEVSTEGEVTAWTVAGGDVYGAPVESSFIGALIRLDGTDCGFLHMIGGEDAASLAPKIRKGARVRAVWQDERSGHMMDIKYFELV